MTPSSATVVVRARDEARGIEAALRSLREQSVNVQIIVVDSGSTDGTLTFARRWCDELIEIPPASFSFGRALNMGAARADCPVVFALSAHCVAPHVDWVRDALEHYAAPDVAATFGTRTGPTHLPLERPRTVTWDDVRVNPHWGYTNQAGSWRRTVWEKLPFNEQLPSSEDKEWMWRVLGAGGLVIADPTAEVPAPHRRAAGLRSLARRVFGEHRAVASLLDYPVPSVRSLPATWWSGFHWSSPRPQWQRRLSPARNVELAAGALGDQVGARRRSARTLVPPPGAPEVSPRRQDPALSAAVVYSTLWTDDQDFNRSVTTLDYRHLGTLGLVRQLARVTEADVVIVNGALGYGERWRDVLIMNSLRLFGRRPRIVVSDATWDPRSVPAESSVQRLWRANEWLGRMLVRGIAGQGTVFCFLSHREVEGFLADTGLPRTCAVFTPFRVTIEGKDRLLLDLPAVDTGSPYVFTGGNTLRDWPLLIEALAEIGWEVRVATRHLDRLWPSNFTVGPVAEEDFFKVAAGARSCIVTLRSDVVRSAGQQTYLNLLRLGVPVVVNDAPGVRDHLDGVPGAWVTEAGDARAIRDRVQWLMDSDNGIEIRALVTAGQRLVENEFGEHAYYARLLQVARSLVTPPG